MRCRQEAISKYACLLILLLSGCAREEEISRHTVLRVSQSLRKLPEESPTGRKPEEQDRMLAAMVSKGRKTWFFKLVGSDSDLLKEQAHFNEFIRSVRFPTDSDKPEWSLPQGWLRLPSSGQRFATLQIGPAEQSLELTVISLVTTPGSFDDYILANINRWREQLTLPPFPSVEAMRAAPPSGWLTEERLVDGSSATVVNMVGRGAPAAAQGSMTASRLPPSHPPIGSAFRDLPPGHPPATPRIKYETPAGWSSGKVDGMRAAAFEVADGERKVEITAISLSTSGGDRLANINRWREQIQLPPTTKDELAKALEPIDIDQHKGEYIEIAGPAGGKGHDAILGALVDVDAQTWFFKLKGDAELAKREKTRFKSFVQSVKFPR